MTAPESPAAHLRFSAERTQAFVDAVVAIAMTLLILPLMESVAEGAAEGENAADWLGHHSSQLISFVLSFAIIAMFWMNHHRLFTSLKLVTSPLMWLTVAWMLTIVWLPVATSITGQMAADDPVAKALYIGTMIVSPLLLLATRLYLRAHPSLHTASPESLTHGISLDIAMALLFALALALALAVPKIGYFALLLMWLTPFARRVVERMLRR